MYERSPPLPLCLSGGFLLQTTVQALAGSTSVHVPCNCNYTRLLHRRNAGIHRSAPRAQPMVVVADCVPGAWEARLHAVPAHSLNVLMGNGWCSGECSSRPLHTTAGRCARRDTDGCISQTHIHCTCLQPLLHLAAPPQLARKHRTVTHTANCRRRTVWGEGSTPAKSCQRQSAHTNSR